LSGAGGESIGPIRSFLTLKVFKGITLKIAPEF